MGKSQIIMGKPLLYTRRGAFKSSPADLSSLPPLTLKWCVGVLVKWPMHSINTGSTKDAKLHPPKNNIEPENDGLEDDFSSSSPGVYSQVPCLSSGVYWVGPCPLQAKPHQAYKSHSPQPLFEMTDMHMNFMNFANTYGEKVVGGNFQAKFLGYCWEEK